MVMNGVLDIIKGFAENGQLRINLKISINRNMTFESQQHENQLQDIIKFTSNFTFQADEHTLVLSSPSHSYLLKDMLVTNEDENQLPTILDTLSLHQNLSPKHLLTLLHYEMYDRYDGNQYIKAVYQYGKLTLRQQIQNRESLNSRFEEDEVWAIFAMLVKALNHLEEQGIIYGVLGADKVFVGEGVKLLDPSATATDPLLISPGRLYSPEIVNDKEDINMFKSDVYVLGLMLLECGLLLDLSKEVECQLSKYIETFSELYSKQLVELIESMLGMDPQSRPSFTSLKSQLVRDLEMNVTQVNELCEPCLPDVQNPPTATCTINRDEQPTTDVLYESPGAGRNLRDSQSECDESECLNTQCQNATVRYLATRQIRPAEQSHKKNRQSASPLSARNNSRDHNASSSSKSKPQMKKQEQRIFTDICNRSAKSSINDCKLQPTAANTGKKQRTKEIKQRLVKNIDWIQQEDTEEQHSQKLSRCPDYHCSDSIYSNQSFQHHQRANNDLISTKKNPGNENLNLHNYNFMDYPAANKVQEFNRGSQHNRIFTDPMLLRTIQDDLAHIESCKSSRYTSRESQRDRFLNC